MESRNTWKIVVLSVLNVVIVLCFAIKEKGEEFLRDVNNIQAIIKKIGLENIREKMVGDEATAFKFDQALEKMNKGKSELQWLNERSFKSFKYAETYFREQNRIDSFKGAQIEVSNIIRDLFPIDYLQHSAGDEPENQ